jgi:hypothetical protein
MVEYDFETDELKMIEKYINAYFQGKTAPKMNRKIFSLLQKITIIRVEFEKIDSELEIDEDE